jgi:ubiquinone/menaquinone biosynthesis C-methylase UbiE
MKNYQTDYAAGRPQMYDKKSREIKGKRIIKLLEIYFGFKRLKDLKVLDVGSSTGIIDNIIAKRLGQVIGADIDKGAIEFANKNFKSKNLTFQVQDALKLTFPENSFDVVICTHVYEHVSDPKKLFQEIYRVLKPGGICYLAAINKWWPIEPHYDLLFLSYLPKNIAHRYVQLFQKAPFYYETLFSYMTLCELTKKFNRIEFTSKIFRQPKKYSYDGKYLHNPLIKTVSFTLSPLMKYLSPTFFWLLEKPNDK